MSTPGTGRDYTSTYERWADERTAPAERVVAFERWVYARLAEVLRWPEGEALRARQIGQARGWVLQMVDDLHRHGFLFRPRELLDEIEHTLARVRTRQDAGLVDDLYAYLRACWQGYVRREADRLRDIAMSTGAHVSQVMGRVLQHTAGAPDRRSVVELVGEVRAARRAERAARPQAAASGQGELL